MQEHSVWLVISPIAVRVIPYDSVTNISTVHSYLMSPARYGPQQHFSSRIHIIQSSLQYQEASISSPWGDTVRIC